MISYENPTVSNRSFPVDIMSNLPYEFVVDSKTDKKRERFVRVIEFRDETADATRVHVLGGFVYRGYAVWYSLRISDESFRKRPVYA